MSKALAERVNGVQEAVRTAVRTARIELDGDYEGWYATMRVNPSLAIWEDFSSGDGERYESALSAIIVDWNIPDDEGNVLPIPRDGLDWNTAPFDLKVRLTQAFSKTMQARMSPPKEPSTTSEPMSQSDT